MRVEEIIKRPLITEKAARQREQSNEYFFAVNPKAKKEDIRRAVEKLFGVKVLSVRTMNVAGKTKRVGRNVGRLSDWKKAIVRLEEKATIKMFEGQ